MQQTRAEAILSAENSGNIWAVRAPPQTRWGAHTAPPGPLAGGRGLLPLCKNAIPTLGLWSFAGSWLSNEKKRARCLLFCVQCSRGLT